jgi:ferredoxin
MGTGPRARAGYDLALTEVRREGSFEYVVEVGSEAGERLLATLPHRAATADDGAAIEHAAEGAAAEQVRSMRDDAVQVLLENVEHPRWDDVAARCLACGNCTMVCPTCFCTTVEDTTSLAGDVATRERRWDSCFTADFSHIVGGPVRRSTRSRYRQWLTHKVATWHEQFGTSGCVGCGRCITWCPVGIDLVEEVRALAGPPASSPE